MYYKLFASLYQGTLRGASHEILVFTNLLAHADKNGIVDKHFRAISEETGLTIDKTKAAVIVLESPDPESRSPDEDGARIVRMDEHRVWGWRIVNYGKYRAIRSEDDRAEQNRLAQQRWRNKNKPPSAEISHGKPPSAQAEAEAEARSKSANRSRPAPVTDEQWKNGLKADIAYRHIDIPAEFSKWQRWCVRHKKNPTQARFEAWLNRIEAPVSSFSGSRTIKPAKQSVQAPELTDEQIAKNKAFIADSVTKLKKEIGR